MTTSVINGREIAEKINAQIYQDLQGLTFKPVICDVVVGEDSVTKQYVNVKKSTAERVGFEFREVHLSSNCSVEDVRSIVYALNEESLVCGIIVQLPLPFSAEEAQFVLDSIALKKDVDCLTTASKKLFYAQEDSIYHPPVAKAVLEILNSVIDLPMETLQAVVIGKGELVGRPTIELLSRQGSRVTALDVNTPREVFLETLAKADVVISATGSPNLINGNLIKEGSVVVDCGTSALNGSVVGDVDSQSVLGKARVLSPVPGGVGPVAVSFLLQNCLLSARAS